MKVIFIIGARPQFIKLAPVTRAVQAYNFSNTERKIEFLILHTGQHYNGNLSQVFFDELEIPRRDFDLGVGSGTHARQTGEMLIGIEQVLIKQRPDWVMVFGDTNSTLAGVLTAAKLQIPVAHVEAGLRSHNRSMPEEINRMVADRLSNLLFCPSQGAVENLQKEGIDSGIVQVGDVMYDSMLFNLELVREKTRIGHQLQLEKSGHCVPYYLVTIHRAENTDQLKNLQGIIHALKEVAEGGMRIVFPIHPRTRKKLVKIDSDLDDLVRKIGIIEPVSYLDMFWLEKNARLILTDSGGIQKEAYWLKVPCITLREETEWIETVEVGANTLAGTSRKRILEAIKLSTRKALSYDSCHYGDGRAAEKIIKAIMDKGNEK